jgi:hypothetical protein
MMLTMTREEWEKTQKVHKTKRNLRHRQQKLVALLYRNKQRFRRNPKAQVELRRIAALCVRLEERFNIVLQEEFIGGIMDS